jgi:hypothetical protein
MYRPSLSVAVARHELISGRGNQFDSKIVDVFMFMENDKEALGEIMAMYPLLRTGRGFPRRRHARLRGKACRRKKGGEKILPRRARGSIIYEVS